MRSGFEKIGKAIIMNQVNYFILLFFSLLIVTSCKLSDENINTLSDYQPPVIKINSPLPFAQCFKQIKVCGIIQDIDSNGKLVEITSLNYSIPEINNDAYNIFIDEKGHFSVAIDLNDCAGNFTIHFETRDKNNNIFKKTLPLFALETPQLQTINSGDGIVIEWLDQDVSGYKLSYRIEDDPLNQITYLYINPLAQYYYLKNPRPGLNYLFQLIPSDQNTIDDKPSSTVASITYLNQFTCVPRISYLEKAIRLDWDAVPGVYGYEIYRSTKRKGRAEKIVYNYKEENYIDNDIEHNVTYWYRIKAVVKNPVTSIGVSGRLVKCDNSDKLTYTKHYLFLLDKDISNIYPIPGGIYALNSSEELQFYFLDAIESGDQAEIKAETINFHNNGSSFKVLDLFVKGNFVYLLYKKSNDSEESLLQVMNLKTPTDLNPVVEEVENFPTNATHIILDNDTLYMLSSHIYFNRYSLANPYNTLFTYQFSTAGNVIDFSISNGQGYLLNTDTNPLKFYDFNVGTMPITIIIENENNTYPFENSIKMKWQGSLFYVLKQNVFQIYNENFFSILEYSESSDDSAFKFKDFAVLGNQVFIYAEASNKNTTGKLICLELSEPEDNQQNE